MTGENQDANSQQVAIFTSREAADAAVHALVAAKFAPDTINLFVQAPIKGVDTRASEDEIIEITGERSAEVGAAAGGLGGVLAGFGLLAVPGVGPVLAIGPLAAGLTGAITGGALGGFAGSLAAFGVSEAEALAAEHHVKHGQVVVMVEAGARSAQAREILDAHGSLPTRSVVSGG